MEVPLAGSQGTKLTFAIKICIKNAISQSENTSRTYFYLYNCDIGVYNN